MEHLHFITTLLAIKDPNITLSKVVDQGTHKEILAKLDYDAPNCPHCEGKMTKYDFQKASKIPYLEMAGFRTLLLLRKRRFQCKECKKVLVAETSLVQKNHQIPVIILQKITEKLVDRESFTAITKNLSVSTSTVIRQLEKFKVETDFNQLPEVMSWDEYTFKKGKMSFIAQDFDSNQIIAILDGRTQTVIRNHFLSYSRQARNRVKVIKRIAFGFRNFNNFKKRILIALNIRKERTNFVLSRK